MSQTYAQRRRADGSVPKNEAAPAQPSLDALRAGAAQPTQEQLGRRVDLPDAMRAKMEDAFGADLSAVKLYESETVADAGANAVTQGANIAFAPGMLDFTSYGGQALLGHEISHVVSQQRGEVTGGGFLNDHALEARADREGAMAAAGQQIAAPTAAMSSVSAAPAAGPMQADKGKKRWNPFQRKEKPLQPTQSMPAYEGVHIDPSQAGSINADRSLYDFYAENSTSRKMRPGGKALGKYLADRYTGSAYKPGEYMGMANVRDVADERYKGHAISGLAPNRVVAALQSSLGEGRSDAEITQIMDNVMAPKLKSVGGTGEGAISTDQAHGKYVEGLKAMKQLYYERLMKMESTYGRLGSQMHPEDFMRQIGPEYFSHTANLQDAAQLMVDAPEGVFDYENSEGDRHFRDLTDYYVKLSNIGFLYSTGKGHFSTEDMMHQIDENAIPKELEERISGPSMDKKQEAAYQKGLRKRLGKEFLFGRFR